MYRRNSAVPTVPDAVTESYRAGIRVVMLTGDYPVTPQNIARQVGLRPLDPVISGGEIDGLDDATLREHARHASIFARVRPEQKLRLVRALKANGEIVFGEDLLTISAGNYCGRLVKSFVYLHPEKQPA